MDNRKHIVIVGGGFAGLNLAKKLDKKLYRVTLVDRNNYHSFPPLFYQVASSGLEPDSICSPFRRELIRGKGKGAEFHLGEVSRVDTNAKIIETQYEKLSYDYLVIAAGTTNNFFGNDKLLETAYTIKSTAQAMRARDEILDRLERASICDDPEKRKEMLSFTVVGGGASGVEIAGALGEMKKYVLPRNYPSIPKDDVSITLLEGSNALLGSMSKKSQEDALIYLKQLLVDVHLGKIVKSYDKGMVTTADGETIPTGMMIWTAGVTGVKIPFEGLEPAIGRGGRIEVDEFNRVKGLEDSVAALGDICIMQTDGYPAGHPQLAQVAIQQGRTLAKNLNNSKFTRAFVYNDKGTMATVGRNRAVADIGKRHLRGFFAWLAWMFIHLISIIGMRNKINILIDWTWGYFNYGTSLRLLLSPSRYPLKWRWGEK